VVFAGGQAFVSCSRNNVVRVFDLGTHAEVAVIPLQGLYPRSLAVGHDGTKVYAAFKLSGNRTTLLPADRAPPQPAPTNGALPAPPQVGLIVSASDARLLPKPNMPDNDVAEINVATRTVIRYFKGTGTVNFGIAPRPGSNELWVANTEARNLVRFEPVLKGHAVDNRVTRVSTAGAGTVTPFDLNPGVNYALIPNNAALGTTLAQPTDLAFTPDGAAFWVASFGTDRVAKIDANSGAVLARIDTGPTTNGAADPRNKRGPRGLAYQAGTGRLYVLNRISNTVGVVSTITQSMLAEAPTGSHDPTPAVIREGRGFLYDALLSANGTQSCASCHVDGDRDDLAWDLGDPGGSMQAVTSIAVFNMHPMKGPMTTQTLRGLTGMNPLHWRGDRADFTKFDHAFESLLGGVEMSAEDMSAFRDFVNTIVFEPNPNQNLDRTMPTVFPPGDPNAGNPNTGRNTFINTDYKTALRCNTCHTLPTGTIRLIIPASALEVSQDFKVPHLRNMYQKQYFKRSATTPSLSGFGLAHDGVDPDMVTFLSRPVFGAFAQNTAQAQTIRRDLHAFMLCFDTGTAPAVGHTRTLTGATLAGGSADWTVLAAQVAAGAADLVVRLAQNGVTQGFVYQPATNNYLSDGAGLGPLTRAEIEQRITNGATATLMGVPPGNGRRMGIDRDNDTVNDAEEMIPMPGLFVSYSGNTAQLAWPEPDGALVLQFSDELAPVNWQPVTAPRVDNGGIITVTDSAPSGGRRFYRLRKP
jgi:DNA-binding beta-propeller fold protein YncE